MLDCPAEIVDSPVVMAIRVQSAGAELHEGPVRQQLKTDFLKVVYNAV